MLSVWLPLNGDLHNQGLSNITAINNGATVDNNGKIGKCYSFDGNDDFINLGNIGSYFDGSAFSICFWIFSLENKTRAAVFSSYGLSSTSNFFGLGLNSSNNNYCNNNLRFDWLGSDTYSPDDFVTYNAWTHICVTYDGVNQIKMYKNGALIQTSTRVLNAIPVGNTYYLGRDSRTGSTAFNGKLNDFRIYDHCLSPRECKQISTALILHYPLAKPGVDNLLTGTDVPFSYAESSDYRKVAGGKHFPLGIDAKELLLTAGERGLTLSYDICIPKIYISSSDTLKRAGIYFSFTVKNKSTQQSLSAYYAHHSQTGTATATNNYAKTNSLNPINASSTADNPDTTFNGHYSRTIYPRQFSNLSAFFADPDSYDVTCSGAIAEIRGGYIKDECSISNVKLEFGDVATPWMPNANEALYTSMGFDDGVEYDVSGFKNNGTINNSSLIETSTDAPRYNTSLIFKRTSNSNSLSVIGYITKENFYMPDEFTISYWWYYDDSLRFIGNPPSVFGYGTPIGYANNGLHNYDNMLAMNFAEFGSDTKSVSNSIQVSYPVGAWHHRCFVFNGNKVFSYRNGTLDQSTDINTTTKMHVVRSSKTLTIGYDQAGGLVRGVSGGLSDFRIYATALSADDILELYHTPLSLSSNGVLLTQGEYTEV